MWSTKRILTISLATYTHPRCLSVLPHGKRTSSRCPLSPKVSKHKSSWSSFYNRKNPSKALPVILVGTTSGTGSEVTKFAVVTDNAEGRKFPLVDEQLIPDLAILDPELVLSAPPSVTADTGMDVITHAFEALVSINNNDASDALAEKALLLSFKFVIFFSLFFYKF